MWGRTKGLCSIKIRVRSKERGLTENGLKNLKISAFITTKRGRRSLKN